MLDISDKKKLPRRLRCGPSALYSGFRKFEVALKLAFSTLFLKTNHKESRKKTLPYSSLWHFYLESVYPSGHTEYTHIHSTRAGLRCVLCDCNCVNNVARNVALRFLHVACMLMACVVLYWETKVAITS